VENSVSSANIAGSVYAQGVESDITCDGNLARSESDFANTVRFRAGLTAKQITRFFARIQVTADCHEWQGSRLPRGYGQFHAGRWPNGKQDVRYAHRVVWELHRGPIPKGLVVRHRCDNPSCCNVAHLALGTQADNIEDARQQGHYRVERPRAWRVEGSLRRAVIKQALEGPRGTLARLCREHNLPFNQLAVAVTRARRKAA
jgi:hypothetical protein